MKKFIQTQRVGLWRIVFSDNAREFSFITSFSRMDFFKVHYHCMNFLHPLRRGHAEYVNPKYSN